MKVFYDYQIFEHQQYGGISRYYAELISQMKNRADVNYMLPILESSNAYLKNIPEVNAQVRGGSDYYNKFFLGLTFPGKWKLYQQRNKWFPNRIYVNQRHSEYQLQHGVFDLFHPTDINNYFLKYIGNKPFVVTIHDMIDEYFPEYAFHVYSTYKTSVKEELVKKAAGIIAVSNSTKHDILKRFSVDERKIKVIYHGGSNLPLASGEAIIPGAYFLYVGKRVHYKNFYFLLQALQPFLIKDSALKIVCVGAPFNSTEQSYFKDLKIELNLVHQSADDSILGNLYHHARGFIYPSLYEGFGIPILEAFQCNCPVMASNTSSLPEVGGDAALYFDPKSIESIQQAFLTLLQSDSVRKDLIEKGAARLKNFSWQTAAQHTFDFYKSIV